MRTKPPAQAPPPSRKANARPSRASEGVSSGPPSPRVIGYLRVSTQDQDLEKFKDDIRRLADAKRLPGPVEWVEEKVSGVKDWRKRKLGEVLPQLQAGDVILTPEVSRLGRSTLQILEVMRECTERGIAVHAVKGGWSLNGGMDSKIVLTMLALFAEVERDLISARTKEGMRAAKERGKLVGRPKGPGKSKLDPHRERILELLGLGVPKAVLARQFATTEANLHGWLAKRGLNKPGKERER